MTKKIKYILLFSILIILGFCTKSQARITTSDPTVESGGTATITINSQEGVASGSIDVADNGGLTFVSVSGGTANGTRVAFAGTENKKSNIATYKFKVPTVTKTTTYKVVFSSEDMATAEGKTIDSSSATATVTVKAKSSGGGSSSGSGSSSNGSSGESSKPQAPSFTSVNETVYATDSVNVRSSYSTSSSVIGSLDKGDSVTRIGKSSSWSKVKYNGQTAYISSDYLTTNKPEEEKKSNNKNLKSLEVKNYKFSPEFSKDVTEYDLKVTEDVEKLEIKAVAEDNKAKVEIKGNDKLLTGVNTIEIKVTAEDKTVRTYKINVTKGDVTEEGTGLSEIMVEGYTLTPEFSSNVHEYTLNIADPSVTSLNIDAKAFEKNAKVEISGNDELKLGENIVTILVTSEDEKNTYTYQIAVNITEKTEENNQIIAGIDNNDLYMYIGIGVAVLVVIIVIIIIIKRRNKENDDFAPYYGRFDSLNNSKNDELSGMTDIKYSTKEKNEINGDQDNLEKDINLNNEILGINKKLEDDTKENRKSVIEENFGVGIDFNNFYDDDRPRKRKGKHSK